MTSARVWNLLSSLTLLAWAGVLLGVHFTGRVVHFLHPAFRPYVWMAGAALLVLGIAHLLLVRNQACCDDDGCGHGGNQSRTSRCLSFLILLAPLLCAAAFSPDQYGKTAVLNRGVAERLSELPPTAVNSRMSDPDEEPEYLTPNEQGNLAVEVVDLIFGTEDDVVRVDFDGKRVELVGQIMPANENNASGTRARLVRMFMMCCAADARPLSVLVDAPGQLDAFPEMSWVKAVGRATYPVEGGKRIVVVEDATLTKSDPPEESLLY